MESAFAFAIAAGWGRPRPEGDAMVLCVGERCCTMSWSYLSGSQRDARVPWRPRLALVCPYPCSDSTGHCSAWRPCWDTRPASACSWAAEVSGRHRGSVMERWQSWVYGRHWECIRRPPWESVGNSNRQRCVEVKSVWQSISIERTVHHAHRPAYA